MHDSSCFTLLMQEHTPMTEDMLLEQATVLAKLGTSEEAARVRAKMQSSSLLSDMQAFKASTVYMSRYMCIITGTCMNILMHTCMYMYMYM